VATMIGATTELSSRPQWRRYMESQRRADIQRGRMNRMGSKWFAEERKRARQTLRRDKQRMAVDDAAIMDRMQALHHDIGMVRYQRNHQDVQNELRNILSTGLQDIVGIRQERTLRLESRRVALDQRLQILRAIEKLRLGMDPEERPLHQHMFGGVAATDNSVGVEALGSTHDDDVDAMDPALIGFRIRSSMRLFQHGTGKWFPELPSDLVRDQDVWPPMPGLQVRREREEGTAFCVCCVCCVCCVLCAVCCLLFAV
jgi:hypothetical protein